MFTGIIESVCTIKSARKTAVGMILSIDLGSIAQSARLGDSISVSGVCLTISKISGTVADFDVSHETFERSTLSKLSPGSLVNIEQAMKADGRFGGHVVQGHIDGKAVLKSVNKRGEFYDVTFSAGPGLMQEIVLKGSVAVDGISLTVASLAPGEFTVAVIPVTWEHTTLSRTRIGAEINIETDILVKVITKQLKNLLQSRSSGLSLEKLAQMGF